jgi:hypothetical protein
LIFLKAQRSSKSLASFAWVPTWIQDISTAHSLRLLAINTEQTFETIILEECPLFDWEPQGNLSIFGQNSYMYIVDQKIQDITGGDQNQENDNNNGLNHHNNSGDHKSHVSLELKVDNEYYNGDRTPRPGDLNGSPKHMMEKDDEKELILPSKVLKDLQEDISVVMRKRAKEGYSMTVCIAMS